MKENEDFHSFTAQGMFFRVQEPPVACGHIALKKARGQFPSSRKVLERAAPKHGPMWIQAHPFPPFMLQQSECKERWGKSVMPPSRLVVITVHSLIQQGTP